VFPTLKRATATGVCNFIARFLTMFAPLVAELERPLPIYILLVTATIGLLVSITFPSEGETKKEQRSFLDEELESKLE